MTVARRAHHDTVDRDEVNAKAFAGATTKRQLRSWSPTRGTWVDVQKRALLEVASEGGASAYVVGVHESKSQEVPVVLFVFGDGTASVAYAFSHYAAVATVLTNDDVDLDALPLSARMVRESDRFICGTHAENPRAFTTYLACGREPLVELLGVVARDAGSGIRYTVGRGGTSVEPAGPEVQGRATRLPTRPAGRR
jgi:hypothetical protein